MIFHMLFLLNVTHWICFLFSASIQSLTGTTNYKIIFFIVKFYIQTKFMKFTTVHNSTQITLVTYT